MNKSDSLEPVAMTRSGLFLYTPLSQGQPPDFVILWQ